MIGIERTKDMLSELGRVAIREKVVIDLLEFFDGQETTRAVLEEAFVPVLDLLLAEVGQLGELAERLRSQSCLAITHSFYFFTFTLFVG